MESPDHGVPRNKNAFGGVRTLLAMAVNGQQSVRFSGVESVTGSVDDSVLTRSEKRFIGQI